MSDLPPEARERLDAALLNLRKEYDRSRAERNNELLLRIAVSEPSPTQSKRKWSTMLSWFLPGSRK